MMPLKLPRSSHTELHFSSSSADPHETTDVSAIHAGKVNELRGRIEELRKTVYAPDRGALDPKACEQIGLNGGYWGPWLNPEQLTLQHS